jgi:hypothetical protein
VTDKRGRTRGCERERDNTRVREAARDRRSCEEVVRETGEATKEAVITRETEEAVRESARDTRCSDRGSERAPQNRHGFKHDTTGHGFKNKKHGFKPGVSRV